MSEINLWAVLVSAIVSMVIGSIWYGPLFGKPFMKAMGMDQWSPEKQALMKKKMGVTYALQFLASLVMFYVLAYFILGMNDLTLKGSLLVAFWAWLGFVVPVKLGEALWGGKMILFWLGIGNMLLTLLAAGAILGAWGA
jgi:hypothetical protein